MTRAASILTSVLLAAAMPAAAAEPGSGIYAEDCAKPEAGYAIAIGADGSAAVDHGGERWEDVLTSYSFFGQSTPADFHIAILFDTTGPLPSKDGMFGWIEIWKGEAAFYALPNGDKKKRLLFCAEIAPEQAKGPSFDCAKDSGSVEEKICADPELARRDWALAAIYRKALGRVEGDADQTATLKAEQRGWIKGRNDCWKADDLGACVSAAYSDRGAVLLARYGLIEAGRTQVWSCGKKDRTVYVTPFMTEPPSINIVRDDEVRTALLRPSGSGSKYEADFGVSFWSKGEEAILEWPEGNEADCSYTGPLGE